MFELHYSVDLNELNDDEHLLRVWHVMTLGFMSRVCIFLFTYFLTYLLIASIVIIHFIRTSHSSPIFPSLTFQVFFATALCFKQNEVRT